MASEAETGKSVRGSDLLASLIDLEGERLDVAVRGLSPHQMGSALQEAARAQREQAVLLEAAESLGSQLELVPLIEKILQRTTSLLQADRASLFLVDREKGELWSKVAQGVDTEEIRFPLNQGIAGHVASTGESLNIADVYEHPLFNPEFDQKTGYRTRSMLCVPVRSKEGDVVGVVSVINRKQGTFTDDDQAALQRFGVMLGVALQNAVLYEQVRAKQQEVSTLLEVSSALSRTLDLATLIQTVMRKASEIIGAERSSLFLIDRASGELWSKVAQGMDTAEIRFPLKQGIAGHVATTGETLNIADAYAHPLFNQEVDQKTGYRTRTILCMPIRNTTGQVLGVTQVINKRAGRFTEADEHLLGAISAQAAVAIDNAQLYERVRGMKAYLENILQSLSNGVLTVDGGGKLTSANTASSRILGAAPSATVEDNTLVGRPAADVLGAASGELLDALAQVQRTGSAFLGYDLPCRNDQGKDLTVNANVVPLRDASGDGQGLVLVMEDITREKRVKSSLSRYMSREVADRLLHEDAELALGGVRQEASILFSDIRSYTTLTEGADAHDIVEMLNEYFSYMVDVIFKYGGILDKFIGDAIMAVFGAPFARPDTDPVNAVATALEMQAQLAAYNQQRKQRGQKAIDTGLGISTGLVICGNIGSEKRMEYTAIGDAVNLASRLEGATKQYGAHIMISEYTLAKIGRRFVSRELDRIRVKGKQMPVRIYEVLAEAGPPLKPEMARLLDVHDRALIQYKERNWKEALALFRAGQEAFPLDMTFDLYARRCQYFMETPPAPDWDGVYDMKDK
jgi:adenylate cyclase